jgi:hypothetical protein
MTRNRPQMKIRASTRNWRDTMGCSLISRQRLAFDLFD